MSRSLSYRSHARLWCAWLFALVLSCPAWAHAAPPEQASETPESRERVLIRVVPEDKRVTSRLRAELDIIGLDVTLLELAPDSPLLGPDLLDQLDDRDASAAIEIVLSEDRVDVWVADSNTSKTLTRRFDLALDPEQGKARTLAIAAVELLRASRLESAIEAPAPEPPAATEQQTELERPPARAALGRAGSLAIGPMIGWSPGTPQSLGTTIHLELAGRWAVREPFALRFSARIPVTGNSVSNELGGARVFVSTLMVEPQWTPRLERALWFRPALGLGLGATITGIVGDPSDENTTRRTPVLGGFTANAHLDLGFVVHDRLWLHLEGNSAVVLPAPRVQFFESTFVATFGLPWVSGVVALELWI